jgi:hypothetical protein
MANVQVLLMNGILRIGELADQPDESFTAELGLFLLRVVVPLVTLNQGAEGTTCVSTDDPDDSRSRTSPDDKF